MLFPSLRWCRDSQLTSHWLTEVLLTDVTCFSLINSRDCRLQSLARTSSLLHSFARIRRRRRRRRDTSVEGQDKVQLSDCRDLLCLGKETIEFSVHPHFRSLLSFDFSESTMPIEVGHPAPDFSLYNTDKKEISLKELTSTSNVVILFFPLAFTGVCTQELCSARDDISNYQKLNATVVGISVDSLFTLDKFRAEQKLPFDLLSDFNKDVSPKYESLYEQFPAFGLKGVTKRSAFVVDRQQVIRYAEILADPGQVPNFALIKETLEQLK